MAPRAAARAPRPSRRLPGRRPLSRTRRPARTTLSVRLPGRRAAPSRDRRAEGLSAALPERHHTHRASPVPARGCALAGMTQREVGAKEGTAVMPAAAPPSAVTPGKRSATRCPLAPRAAARAPRPSRRLPGRRPLSRTRRPARTTLSVRLPGRRAAPSRDRRAEGLSAALPERHHTHRASPVPARGCALAGMTQREVGATGGTKSEAATRKKSPGRQREAAASPSPRLSPRRTRRSAARGRPAGRMRG